MGIDESKLSKDTKFTIKTVLYNSLPPLIDTSVALSYKINNKSKFGKFFSKIRSCLCETPIEEPELPALEEPDPETGEIEEMVDEILNASEEKE